MSRDLGAYSFALKALLIKVSPARSRRDSHNFSSMHVYIYRLRHKLLPYNLQIDTLVNVGYRLLARKSARR
jgi:DNA-binding response OmpR family regulator